MGLESQSWDEQYFARTTAFPIGNSPPHRRDAAESVDGAATHGRDQAVEEGKRLPQREAWLLTGGGAIRCCRCIGTSRRTGMQCGAPAEQHSERCRFHGARATGPTTLTGLERCAQARNKGLGDTRARRQLDRQTMRLIKACGKALEELQQ